MPKKGLFQLIRETSFTKFLLAWIISIFVFGIIYWLSSLGNSITVYETPIKFTFLGLFNGIFASLLIAILFGVGSVVYSGTVSLLVDVQLVLSGILLFILVDKIIVKYVHPHYRIMHHQDKKINTLMLMMSVFRNDVDRLMHRYTLKKRHITIKDIETTIDGLYVAFLDVEKLFSEKNLHRHKITTLQYLMLTENIQDSLHKLEKFIDFMQKHEMHWRDHSTEFWMRYILDTAGKIVHNVENSDIKSHKVLIAVGNIRDSADRIKASI